MLRLRKREDLNWERFKPIADWTKSYVGYCESVDSENIVMVLGYKRDEDSISEVGFTVFKGLEMHSMYGSIRVMNGNVEYKNGNLPENYREFSGFLEKLKEKGKEERLAINSLDEAVRKYLGN